MSRKITITSLLVAIVVAVGAGTFYFSQAAEPDFPDFDGDKALAHIEHQLSLGPRIPGSAGHNQIVDWMQTVLAGQGWQVEKQELDFYQQDIINVIARRGKSDKKQPWYIFGAHYDTRIYADQDPNPENHTQPVPGANDGASGVALLLELARTIPKDYPAEIWLVFFDAEDNGRIEGWDWILGSRAFAQTLESHPDAVLIVDMIGDADLNIFMEKNSDKVLTAEVWGQAALLGHGDHFIPTFKFSMLDDHTPFLQAGIPAMDIIDFDYPYWHTVDDTLDKVSAASLQIVGETLLAWLEAKRE